MKLNISLTWKKAKTFFLSHKKTSYLIGLFFICSCLYVDYVTISNTCHKIDNLEYKEGVVSYWNHTGGEFNDATLKIRNDTNVYITQRYDGWLCFQHNGKKGETVTFYTVKHEVKDGKKGIPYYGLCEKGNPRTTLWLFFDILFSCYNPVLIWWALGAIGTILFNFQIIRDYFILPLSIVVLGVSLLMFIMASIS